MIFVAIIPRHPKECFLEVFCNKKPPKSITLGVLVYVLGHFSFCLVSESKVLKANPSQTVKSLALLPAPYFSGFFAWFKAWFAWFEDVSGEFL